MDVQQFEFELPDELIALRPASPRDAARMLVVHADGRWTHAQVRDLPQFLNRGDMLVVNDTKVIPARLRGRRAPRQAAVGEGPKVEILLHKRLGAARFLAFARPARKLEEGDTLLLGETLEATVLARGAGGEIEISLGLGAPPSRRHAGKMPVLPVGASSIDAVVAREGETPLPPYIAAKRGADWHDVADYQTIYAAKEGSVAAPTAGLHFTPELLERLAAAGILREAITLHVGAGTFLPVTVEDTAQHKMHAEWAEMSQAAADAINAARERAGRIAAVGTTALRTLESAAAGSGRIASFSGETSLFVTPGYRFKTADILLTNFHLPRSTLFMLVCAFCGTETMKRAYAEAIAARYRFYSYGDVCLLFRPHP
jgi:S-adenosylmethionine:tRNA ribosyltransferase-isomerase